MDEPGRKPGALWPPLLEAAVRLAARAHHGHFRKRDGGDGACDGKDGPLPEGCIPYITHLVGTACILARLGASEEVVAAGFLHDFLEDVAGPDGPEAIRAAAGEEVLRLVRAVTEDKLRERSATESWEDRKHAQLERLEQADDDVILLKGADTLHNVLSLLADLGDAPDPALVWDRFNAPPDLQLWYLASVATTVRRRLGAHPLAHELEAAVAELRNRVEARTHHLHDVKGRDLKG